MSIFLRSCLGGMLSVCLLLSVAACNSSVNQENFSRIEPGMAETEVIKMLGEPTETTSIDLGLFSGTTATWRHKGTVIAVQFINGKVQTKQMYRSEQPAAQPR